MRFWFWLFLTYSLSQKRDLIGCLSKPGSLLVNENNTNVVAAYNKTKVHTVNDI